MNALRIFLADDHAVVREGLKKLIEANLGMHVIGEAEDGRTACDTAISLKPDVAVMDISMPRLNGIEATSRITKLCPETRILALSMHEDPGYLERIMKAGASGYVLKSAASEDLIRGIEAVAAGETFVDPSMARKLMAKSILAEQEHVRVGKLSVRESDVLKLIAKGHTNKEISGQLHLSEKSVETYKARGMSKLGLRGRADVVRYAVEHDWLTLD